MPYFRVKPYENYIQYYPNSIQASGHVPSGEVFEIETPDKDQLYKLDEITKKEYLAITKKVVVNDDQFNASKNENEQNVNENKEPEQLNIGLTEDALEAAKRKLRDGK